MIIQSTKKFKLLINISINTLLKIKQKNPLKKHFIFKKIVKDKKIKYKKIPKINLKFKMKKIINLLKKINILMRIVMKKIKNLYKANT